MAAEIEDQRDVQNIPQVYIVATDSFLSGWGKAPNRSLVAFACHSPEEADTVEDNMHGRADMKRVRVVTRIKRDGTPDVRLQDGDHLAIKDRGTAHRFYEPGAFRR